MTQGGSLGSLGWWSDVCNLKNVRLLLLRVDRECNRPFFLATVFQSASAFNGDLSQWDVATVFTMQQSKSIRIGGNDLT